MSGVLYDFVGIRAVYASATALWGITFSAGLLLGWWCWQQRQSQSLSDDDPALYRAFSNAAYLEDIGSAGLAQYAQWSDAACFCSMVRC